ncbi:MAG: helix-turn-helix transcriptional regulator [Acidobacteriia bacterium]|nr:helix-turn-helix transcriptional regulator [Terriglobia bacterium]
MPLAAGARVKPKRLGWGREGANGLSGRELQVIALLARGLTNKQIAQTLSITPVTVKHHLSHIFCKLGIENRLQLAVLAFNQGLVAVSPTTTFSPPGRS